MGTAEIAQSTVSHAYLDYLMEGITSNREQRTGRLQVLNDRNQRRLDSIVSGNRQSN